MRQTGIRPGIDRLLLLIAGLETVDLAAEGRLEAEAARIRAEQEGDDREAGAAGRPIPDLQALGERQAPGQRA